MRVTSLKFLELPSSRHTLLSVSGRITAERTCVSSRLISRFGSVCLTEVSYDGSTRSTQPRTELFSPKNPRDNNRHHDSFAHGLRRRNSDGPGQWQLFAFNVRHQGRHQIDAGPRYTDEHGVDSNRRHRLVHVT